MNETGRTGARVLGPNDGDIMGAPDGVRDRFMVSRGDSGGGFALVEHLMAPKALAAPLHIHTGETSTATSSRAVSGHCSVTRSSWPKRGT